MIINHKVIFSNLKQIKHKTFFAILLSVFTVFLSIFFHFIITPLLIEVLGTEEYALRILVNSFSYVIVLFFLGIPESINKLFNYSEKSIFLKDDILSLNLIISLSLIFLFCTIYFLFIFFFQIPFNYIFFYLFFINIVNIFLFNYYNLLKNFIFLQNNLILNSLIGFSFSLVSNITTYFILQWGQKSITLAISVSLVYLFFLFLVGYFNKSFLFKITLFNNDFLKRLIKYLAFSKYILISLVFFFIFNYFSQIFISLYLTPEDTIIFQLSHSLRSYFVLFLFSILNNYTPFIYKFSSSLERINLFFLSFSPKILLISNLFVFGFIFTGRMFLSLWLGTIINIDTIYYTFILFAFLTNAYYPYSFSIEFYRAVGKEKVSTLISILSSLFFVFFTLFFGLLFGYYGVIFGITFNSLIFEVIVLSIFNIRLGLKMINYWKYYLYSIFISFVSLIFALGFFSFFSSYFENTSLLLLFIIKTTLFTIFYLILSVIFNKQVLTDFLKFSY